MSIVAETNTSIGTKPESHVWSFLVLIEAGIATYAMARIAFGPISAAASPLLWSAGAAALLLAYLLQAFWSVSALLMRGSSNSGRARLLLWISTLPFLTGFLVLALLLQFMPGVAGQALMLLSPIQPFPILGVAILLLMVLLLKSLLVSLFLSGDVSGHSRVFALSADIAIPVALLVIGVLQASVYVTPIGNAFLRFWAIADAINLGAGYAVTLTEPGPVAAGSPPYVYDLPLFPLMLLGSFRLLGHNSAAAHLPAAVFNALFPLSLYLLIREATRSRTIALIFAALASLFPYLRSWVLNLPDPDPLLLTSACFAAYFYLRALASRERPTPWIVAGVASGILSLGRPEGILYAGFIALGMIASRPKPKRFALFLSFLGLFLVPMVAVWESNFGFLWPQNYNRTLRLDYPLENFEILKGTDALGFYQRGLGLDAQGAFALLVLFTLSVLLGTVVMTLRDRRLLAFALPGIGNTVAIFFANPYIPNTFHFADFFRHASFGIPFLVVTSAYGFHQAYGYLVGRRGAFPRMLGHVCLILVVAAVAREGDILANPTATHRAGATQVLTDYTHLSMQSILEHPFSLPTMTYQRQADVVIAYPTSIAWPDDALAFYKPLDMSFDGRGIPFGYASVVAFLLALCYALMADRRLG